MQTDRDLLTDQEGRVTRLIGRIAKDAVGSTCLPVLLYHEMRNLWP
ncbi:hypothetical protein L0156_20295 [bacterium]|nr:hypothetical protein [bacterium]